MGKILIIISTVLVIITIEGFKRINNKKFISRIKDTLKEINNTYRELFNKKGKMYREIHGLIFIFSEIFVVIMILRVGINNIANDKTISSIIMTILGVGVSLIVIHLAIGYTLQLTSGIQKFIINVEDKYLKNNLIISYFILTTYFTVFIFDSRQFEGVHG